MRRLAPQNIPLRELLRQRHFPNVELINQDGRKVHFYDDLLKDRKVVINFMFTKCEKACPIITSHLLDREEDITSGIHR